MPRANRYFLPGHVRRISHRCHKKVFLSGNLIPDAYRAGLDSVWQ